MRPIVEPVETAQTPESVVDLFPDKEGVVLLRTSGFDSPQARYSFVVADPFLTFRSWGSRCEIRAAGKIWTQFGNPWLILDTWMSRFELLDEIDFPFPLGGCFGYWGYDLKNFVEPRLPRRARGELDLPDCAVGFYSSVLVFDHHLGQKWIVATGLDADGSREETRARHELSSWRERLAQDEAARPSPGTIWAETDWELRSNLSRGDFLRAAAAAQDYIRKGDIYQVNLSQRLAAAAGPDGWNLFQRLAAVSPAPFSAFLGCGSFEIASSSPELFLRMSGSHVLTRPIKGTRPRSADPTRDAQLTYELQTSAKEIAELVMITDLLRNDLGKISEFGSVRVPELLRLERFAQVQHLISTVEGTLRAGVTHFGAFASCFPGGSITGAPKIRAMEIIDELEPVTRGPYTGAIGYLGFNRESALSIAIRTAVRAPEAVYFHVGAGIVADSDPEAEYEETWAKAAGFLRALELDRAQVRENESTPSNPR